MTDKERLEMIKGIQKRIKECQEKGQNVSNLHPDYVDWLINRVEELEKVIGDLDENVAAFETLWLEEKIKNKRYKQFIEHFAYSDEDYEGMLRLQNKAKKLIEGENRD